MKKVLFVIFLVLICSGVFAAVTSYVPESVKPERINVPYGNDVNLDLKIGEVVEARVYEGTKIYFPVEKIEAEFWVNEITNEYVKGQLSIKGGKFVEKTIKRDDLKKSNAIKLDVYGGTGADMLIRYLYYHDGATKEEKNAVLVFDVFKQATMNPDGTYSFVNDPNSAIKEVTDVGTVVPKKDPYLMYFYIAIGLLVVVLVYIIFFRKGKEEGEIVYSPTTDNSKYVLESNSEPVEHVNVSEEPVIKLEEKKVVKKVAKKKAKKR